MNRRPLIALAAAGCVLAALPLASAAGDADGPRRDPRPTWTPGQLRFPPPPDNPSLTTVRKIETRALRAAGGRVAPFADRRAMTIVRSTDARCRNGWLTVGLRNGGARPVYGDLTAEAGPLKVSRPVLSTYLPASYEARTQLRITAPPATRPGTYTLRLRSGGQRLAVPVTVAAPGPGKDNLACGRPVTASSSDPSGRYPAASVTDGNLNGEEFGVGNGWNDGTASRWPDTVDVALAAARPVGRVVLHTLDSDRYDVARYGLRDWDVQVRADGVWTTVARSRANASARVEHTFAPVAADAVRVVALGSNDGRFARIIELEVFGP
ncbi:discoidin domain-containing protein [Spirillospora sp. NPDC050679]